MSDKKYKIIEIKQSIYANNDKRAFKLCQELKEEKTFLLNLMSSPGSGKTTTLLKVLHIMKQNYRIGVMEADIDSDVDADVISQTGVKTIQLHTGGMCHLDADMTRQVTLTLQFLKMLETQSVLQNLIRVLPKMR